MRTYTILLVDDEPNVTASLARYLHQEPFRVLRAESAREAIDILKQETIDVVISDERMPGVSGTELLGHLQRIHPDVIRMILTGHASLESALKAINEGQISRFFIKPSDPAAIGYAVREALQQRMLQEENEALHARVAEQERVLEHLEKHIPGITDIEFDEDGAVVLDGPEDD
jgi:DNA-binding NtrC family response regulator